ncbi:DUF4144 family protein [Marinobacterium jannaschii]|uniref:DUF4144 family protein n=1 Tax=Marinobacterium jannaschii TaxID=64970 RepID=UPI000489B5D3|nr:DUF4144 family protein [Marinobacterium jannaschii]
MEDVQPEWPGVISFVGVDELLPVKSQQQLDSDPELVGTPFTPDDRLIDSAGRVYRVLVDRDRVTRWVPTEQLLCREEVLRMMRQHFSAQGDCCVAKISFASVRNAIRALADGH